MIAVSLNHPLCLFIEHSFHRSIRADLIPHPWFGVQIETETIRSFKRCFGWAPGMEPHVIQPPGATQLKQFFPVGNISRRITSKWEVAAGVRPSEDYWTAGELQLFAFCLEVTQSDFKLQ